MVWGEAFFLSGIRFSFFFHILESYVLSGSCHTAHLVSGPLKRSSAVFNSGHRKGLGPFGLGFYFLSQVPLRQGKRQTLGVLHKPNNPFVSVVCDRLIRDSVDKLKVGLCKVSVGKHPVLGKVQ